MRIKGGVQEFVRKRKRARKTADTFRILGRVENLWRRSSLPPSSTLHPLMGPDETFAICAKMTSLKEVPREITLAMIAIESERR